MGQREGNITKLAFACIGLSIAGGPGSPNLGGGAAGGHASRCFAPRQSPGDCTRHAGRAEWQ